MLQRIKFRVLHILIKCSATELQSGPGTFGFVCTNLMHCSHYLFKDFILLMCVECGEGVCWCPECVWRSEDNLVEFVFLFDLYVDPRN